jgi:hypothetical protein
MPIQSTCSFKTRFDFLWAGPVKVVLPLRGV